ncbi:NAD(P)-binding protein [Mycena sanguinolenta]|uniref:NAD(P)-binding protein n=1 Tax=Mycena sanguinolenta TaxID=230812 RepID=A0A8H6YQJ8_9AGAR|nr:NAD(P)-binding protein [Mycena sanguinolenta]
MPPNAAAALQSVSLVGQNKTAVVVGGTLGIGAGVARLLAKLGCSRIIIVGRNETRGKAGLETMKKLAPKGSNIVVEFVKADLSDSKGMKNAATAIQEAAGDGGIDYLVMTQNGTPAGHNVKYNADGHDIAFAVQAISRFALAYLLTTRGGLAENAIVMSVANQGQTFPDLSIDDLSLKERLKEGETTLFMNQSKRDSMVLDSVFEELNIRYPQYRYYSLYPGLVKTEEFNFSIVPGFIKVLFWVGLKLIGTTPDQYAVFPVYILAAPDAQKTLGSAKYFGRVLQPAELGAWAKVPKEPRSAVGKAIGNNRGDMMRF